MSQVIPALSALTGGAAGALDALYTDGETGYYDEIIAGDVAIVFNSGIASFYQFNVDASGYVESSPTIIKPDKQNSSTSYTGNGAWLLASQPNVFIEYASCDDTQTNSGVAANTVYTPDTPVTSSNGSPIPSVTISGTTATTFTAYSLAFPTAITADDTIILEIKNAYGWTKLGDTATIFSYATFNGVPIGLGWYTSNTNVITATFSNAGRLQGATHGVASGTWASLAASHRWRLKKISIR